jgi:hypothetical protein
MTNLYHETCGVLAAHNKKAKDVLWVGTEEAYTNWTIFKKNANVEYDQGFGAAKVAQDLLIVGEGWWMERHEYDGSEWWEFKTIPTKPEKIFPKTVRFTVKSDQTGWETMNSINNPEE